MNPKLQIEQIHITWQIKNPIEKIFLTSDYFEVDYSDQETDKTASPIFSFVKSFFNYLNKTRKEEESIKQQYDTDYYTEDFTITLPPNIKKSRINRAFRIAIKDAKKFCDKYNISTNVKDYPNAFIKEEINE